MKKFFSRGSGGGKKNRDCNFGHGGSDENTFQKKRGRIHLLNWKRPILTRRKGDLEKESALGKEVGGSPGEQPSFQGPAYRAFDGKAEK